MATAENVWAWSATATDNATADSAVIWSEGQDPATVNNSARAMMAAIRKFQATTGGNVTVGGTGNAIIITTSVTISAANVSYGFRIAFIALASNTGATTVAVDGLSPVAVKRPNGDALSVGDIVAGGIYDIAFDGTAYRLLGAGAPAGTAALGSNNTWTGNNNFTGDTSVGDASDGVIIKGHAVSSFMASLFSKSSADALRTAMGVGTTSDVLFNSVTTTGNIGAYGTISATTAFNTNQYQYGGTNVVVDPTFISAMLSTLPSLGTVTAAATGLPAGSRIVAQSPPSGGFVWGIYQVL